MCHHVPVATHDWQAASSAVHRLVDALNDGPARLPLGADIDAGTALAARLNEVQEAARISGPAAQIALLKEMIVIAADQAEAWAAVRDAVLDLAIPQLGETSDRELGRLANLSGPAIQRRRARMNPSS